MGDFGGDLVEGVVVAVGGGGKPLKMVKLDIGPCIQIVLCCLGCSRSELFFGWCSQESPGPEGS